MGPRIYPSQQNTNLTAKGSLILSIDSSIDYVDVYVNDILVNKKYSVINGLYSVSINVNDVVRLERGEIIKISSTRKDYTTDDTAGNNGIVNTFITGITSTNSYTFTATTSPSSYNFEYLISVTLGGARATLIYKYNPTIINNLGALFNVKRTSVYGFPTTGGTAYYILDPSVPQFTGTTSFTFNLGEVPIPRGTGATITAAVGTFICYITTNGNTFQGDPSSVFKIYVNGILQTTSTYYFDSPGFGYVSDCPNELRATEVIDTFTCNDGDTIEYVFDDTFTMLNFDPTFTPTPTPAPPTPTPTITNTPSPTPTPTATNTPTPTPTPVPNLPNITTRGLTIYTDGSGTSYPGFGSSWFNRVTGTTITGATMVNSPTWNTSENGYFTFNGTNQTGNYGAVSSGDTTSSVTFGGWVKMATGSTKEVMYMRGLGGSAWNLQLYKETDDRFKFSILNSNNGVQNCSATGSTITNNQWYHVMAQFRPNNYLRIYINGVLNNSVSITTISLRSTLGLNGWYLSYETNSSDFDISNIGDFEFYDTDLTNSEILFNFDAKKSLYGY
jgi:hypothetical protein